MTACEDCGTTEREVERSEQLGVTLCGPCFGKRADRAGVDPVALKARADEILAMMPEDGRSRAERIEDAVRFAIANFKAERYWSENGAAARAADRSTWAPVDLAPILAGEEVDEPPTQLERIDGTCLLYRGKLHAVHGEPETAKGWLLLHAAAEEIDKGEHVAYVDFEDDARTFVARLRAIGLSDEAIAERFHYIRPNEQLNEDGRAALEQELGAHRPSLVIIDGVTEALTLEGLSLSDNTEVAQWMEQLPRWIRDKTGAAVVLIDHVTKDREARGRFAIGAQHKLAGVDVAYSVKVVEVFGRGLSGRIQVTVHKDRPGHVRQHAIDGIVAEVGLESRDDGAVAIVVQPPDPQGWRPTKRMEEVSQFIEGNDGASQRAIREDVGGKGETTIDAIKYLISDGYVRTAEGANRSTLHHSIRPYRDQSGGSQPEGTTWEPPGVAPHVSGSPGSPLWGTREPPREPVPGTTAGTREPPGNHPPTSGRSSDSSADAEVWDYTDDEGAT